ncbi:BAG domain-containing protein Samui-like isoform X2 [Hylaeus anthracinus]|uniref:BAG domain-containing protein Samui-like isoform X2 n=1 Tax=Hylaeus anthracinus TaxID=313031 RepID=UPI0023B90E4E|nr:BAG domain-containing protein Samui-like isoform X2 [Hylaeus anthracinus]
MDFPVIVDKASEFGKPIDLDRDFLFDDDGFGRRSDIRSHLDDLAARHPEFADHLVGPPWGDIPFHSSFRNRNRGSGNAGTNNYQGYSDEDARSQASGSSAASGASAVSSHGEPEANLQDKRSQNFEQPSRRNQIPQYGLRNTVDIGQHHHNMENPDKASRGQRSMSAPPENRQSSSNQQPQQQEQQSQQPQGQRYVSRIDITPQHNQPQQPQQPQPQPQPQQQQQPQQQPQQHQSNVRHIPIFVEGRDEPVLPRNIDESHFRREPSNQFNPSSDFKRSSIFTEPSFGTSHKWFPQFQDAFYPQQTAYEQPTSRQQHTHYQQPKQQQYAERQPPQQHYEQPRQQQRQSQQQRKAQQQQQPQQQHQQPPQQEPPKPKPCPPKDPLERVALVQKEVDSLAEQVKSYTGNSRTEKQYIYLDEMLTRELIKLDDIETEGRDNVRQARKNAIRTIQETISLLESKAPLPSQQITESKSQVSDDVHEPEQSESMDVDQKTEESQTNEPIPLPPGPSSPTKMVEESNPDALNEKTINSANDQADKQSSEPMDIIPAEKSEATPMEVQQTPEQANTAEKTDVPEVKDESVSEANKENISEEKKPEKDCEKKEAVSEEMKPEDASKNPETVPEENKKEEEVSKEKTDKQKDKVEVDEVKQSQKATKKGKKTKKQVPVSDKPIPMPPPDNAEENAK